MEARGDLHGKHEINLQQLLTRYGYERGRVPNPSFQEILILMRPLSRIIHLCVIHVKHRSWLIGKLFCFNCESIRRNFNKNACQHCVPQQRGRVGKIYEPKSAKSQFRKGGEGGSVTVYKHTNTIQYKSLHS